MPESGTITDPSVRAATLRRFTAFQILTATQFDGAIWMIYLHSRGFSLGQIGLAESAFHLAPLLLELPSGVFADLVGRRWVLALGAALIAVSSALIWNAASLPIVLLGMFLSGASYSVRSGADQAYLYDALRGDRDQASGYAAAYGRILGASYLVGAATIWIGARLSEHAYGLTYGVAIGVALAAVRLAVGLAERPPADRRDRPPRARSALRGHLAETWRIIAGQPAIGVMLGFSAVFWTAWTVAELYLQTHFQDRGIANGEIGLVSGLGLVLVGLGSRRAGWFARRMVFTPGLALLVAVTGIGLAGTAGRSFLLAGAGFLAASLATGFIEPLLSAWFNQRVPSARRATVLSLESWLFSLVMIGAFPLAGRFAERHGWLPLYALAAGMMILMAGAIVIVWGLRDRQAGDAGAGKVGR